MFSTATKILIARMLYFLLHALRRPFGFRDQVVARRRGVVWNLDLREGIDLTIYVRGAFERDTLRALESLVREGATVLDVGANVGAHTLHLARLVGATGRVVAFEPTDFAMAKLRANLEANPELRTATVDIPGIMRSSGKPIMNDDRSMCIDVQNGNPGNLVPIWLYWCNANPAQQWHYDPKSGKIRNTAYGKCLVPSRGGLWQATPSSRSIARTAPA